MADVLTVVAKVRAAKGKGDTLAALLKEQVAAAWDFDPALAQVVTDDVTGALGFQLQYVRGKPGQVEFTSKETFRPPVVLEAEVRLPFRVTEMAAAQGCGEADVVWDLANGMPARTRALVRRQPA